MGRRSKDTTGLSADEKAALREVWIARSALLAGCRKVLAGGGEICDYVAVLYPPSVLLASPRADGRVHAVVPRTVLLARIPSQPKLARLEPHVAAHANPDELLVVTWAARDAWSCLTAWRFDGRDLYLVRTLVQGPPPPAEPPS